MSTKRIANDLFKTAAGLCAAGVLLGSSCSSSELEAIVTGVEAAANSLDNREHEDNITFGEWLLSELDD
ncbi:MAG: hypothetical protein WBE26_10370 [Phycisphaerae bacterium]